MVSGSEAGTLSFTGPCGDAAPDAIPEPAEEVVLTFGPLEEGEYSGCVITLTDVAGNSDEGSAVQLWDFTVDTTAPELVEARLESSYLILTFSEDMDTSDRPDPSAFTVKVDGEAAGEVYEVLSSGDRGIALDLALRVPEGATVTLDYVYPGSGDRLQDRAGNALPDVTGFEVTVE